MCGIFALIQGVACTCPQPLSRQVAIRTAKTLEPRGPDEWCIFQDESCVMIHQRLQIIDPAGGRQPFVHDGVVLVANGEVYNHEELRQRYSNYPYQTHSDCEVFIALYHQFGAQGLVDKLCEFHAMFAFVLYDTRTHTLVAARDHMGIIPLYHGESSYGRVFASELKAISPLSESGMDFAPGCALISEASNSTFTRWYSPTWLTELPSCTPPNVKTALTEAVRMRLMSDVPWGVLLSGGLDSSVVAALAQQMTEQDIHTFSIGLEGSPDLACAREVAEHIGSIHHEFTYTVQEGLDSLEDVIYTVETYDQTTVRASTPMYLLARKIKALGFKMVLSGEGADEAFAGYLYFHHAPSPADLHWECVDKLRSLSRFDCQRANKSMARWGVEVRTPFLDVDVLEAAMDMDPQDKMIHPGVEGQDMEKHVIRRAFEGLLPPHLLWRQKEQFSDGVGYGWIDALKASGELAISDALLESMSPLVNPPLTKESAMYRVMFNQSYPLEWQQSTVSYGASVACSTGRGVVWCQGMEADPSGRAVGVHSHYSGPPV